MRRSPQLKRVIDIALSVIALALSAPLQAAAAVTVRISLGSPVIFRQRRPGLHGEPFEIIKFRTMRPVDIDRGWVSDEERLTAVGSLLRATSIDELPALWNVLKGDMSLVGPRPLLMEYLPLYNDHQVRRHEVRPGLTGLAQISGRNALSWGERLELDVQYVDRWTHFGDFLILAQTVKEVLRREGISAEGHVTMHRFQGSPARDQ